MTKPSESPGRILIIGNAGSGKSFLAKAIATQLALPVIDLDTIFWLDGSYTAKRPAGQVWAAIDRIHEQDRWIVEGVYGSMVERLLDRADLLIWLALPWESCRAAVIDREAQRAIKTATPKEFEALLAYGAAYDERTNDISREGHQRLFDRFAGRRLRYENREQVNSFIASVV